MRHVLGTTQLRIRKTPRGAGRIVGHDRPGCSNARRSGWRQKTQEPTCTACPQAVGSSATQWEMSRDDPRYRVRHFRGFGTVLWSLTLSWAMPLGEALGLPAVSRRRSEPPVLTIIVARLRFVRRPGQNCEDHAPKYGRRANPPWSGSSTHRLTNVSPVGTLVRHKMARGWQCSRHLSTRRRGGLWQMKL